MSPYVGAVIFFVVFLFIPISLAPLVDHSPDMSGVLESKRSEAVRDDQRERMERESPEARELPTL